MLSALFAKLSTPTVDVVGVAESELEFARSLGFSSVFRVEEAPRDAYDVVLETSGVPVAFAMATDLADSGGRLALVGLPVGASPGVDQNKIALKDLSMHGILHGLNHYREVATLYGSGAVDPSLLIAGVVKPEAAADALGATADGASRTRPKYLIEFAGETG